MAEISASLVKELRGRTGAGMMDCKKALTESEGNLDTAIDWLRTKGLAAAAKKAGRVTAQGLVAVSASPTAAAMVEINSETDFVARNELFQLFARTVAELALARGGDLDDLLGANYPGQSHSVADQVAQIIATVGENLSVRRVATVSVESGLVASYVHGALAPNLGRIGTLVGLRSSSAAAELAAFGKQLAMHVAAANPQSVSVAELDDALVAREREVLKQQALESGKPEAIVDKMVEGRLRKYYEDVVLLEQTFVIDGESRVSEALAAAAAAAGAAIEVTRFERFALGEDVASNDSQLSAEAVA
jgi:elongation factor Ts